MKAFRSISSVILICLVFFASSNFIVGMHFCGGHVQKVSLFTKAEGCGMEKKLPPCKQMQAKTCCEDEAVVHDAQTFKNDLSKVHVSLPAFSEAIQPVILAEVIPSIIFLTPHSGHHLPPARSTDITLSIQVFLI